MYNRLIIKSHDEKLDHFFTHTGVESFVLYNIELFCFPSVAAIDSLPVIYPLALGTFDNVY